MDENRNYENEFEMNNEPENISPIYNENQFEQLQSDMQDSYEDNTYHGNEITQNGYLFEEDDEYNSYGSDFSTSGENYNFAQSDSECTYENTNEFYNTSFTKKSSGKVPLVAAVAAVVITAVVSIGASFGYNYYKDIASTRKDSPAVVEQAENSAGSAVVATATTGRNGEKLLTTPEIVDKVGPAVVGIVNTTEVTRSGIFYDIFGGGGTDTQTSSGSGVVISSDGYIVTNSHVVEGAKSLKVIMNTGAEYEARMIGADSRTDIAVLKIEAEGLTSAEMGTSSDLRVGDTAIAIGNPLGQEFAGTTTQGIISGLNRSVTIDNKQLTLIQTDAAINPGNSGGALVDAYGHLVGINTAKISSSTLEGLGFAIPIDEAKPIISELIDNGYVTGRPILGIGGRAVTEEDAKAYNLKVGVYVTSMTPGSPAYMAGIKIGDTIVECEGKAVKTVDDINAIKNKHKPGDELELKVYRQKSYKKITVILGEELPGSN